VLEGVGRQRDAPSGAAEHGVPVDGDAVDVGLPQRAQQRLGFAAVPAQCGHRHQTGPGFAHERRQGAVGADFEDGGDALSRGGVDAVGESDGGADVAYPVLGGRQLLPRDLTGDVGDHRDQGLVVGDFGEDLGELVEHRCHEAGVESVAHAEALHAAALGCERVRRLLHGRLLTRKHHSTRPVDGSQPHTRRFHDLGLLRLDGPHRATGRQLLHQPSPRGDDPAGVLQRPHPRHVRRRQLAQRMAEHHVGAYAPRLQQP